MSLSCKQIKVYSIYLKVLCIFLIIYFFNITLLLGQKFEHLSLEQGISHNLTHAIIQDRQGFMWFGTLFGLIKYDGRDYMVYRNDPSDPASISHDDILTIFEDSEGILWIGTRGGGLNRFNYASDNFTRYIFDENDSTSLSNNNVRSICQDAEGSLWVGTENGLNKLEYKYIKMNAAQRVKNPYPFKRYINSLWDVTTISDNIINSLFKDSEGLLWIGTQNGLNRFNPDYETFKHYYQFNPDYTKIYMSDVYKHIKQLKNKNTVLGAITKVGHFADHSSVFSISETSTILIYAMGEGRSEYRGLPIMGMSDFGWLEDATGNKIWEMRFGNTLWAGGSEKNRVQMVTLLLKPGQYRLRYQSDDSHTFDNWNTMPPYQPQDWGIQAFSLNSNESKKTEKILLQKKSTNLNSISHNAVTAIIACDNANYLWIGTAGGGLNKFDKRNDFFLHYGHNPKALNSIASDHINTLYNDPECQLWIGTAKGVSRLNTDTETFTNYQHYPNVHGSLSGDNIMAIARDRSGLIWIGAYWGGIDKLDTRKNKFDHIRKNISAGVNLDENIIFSVYSWEDSVLWLGTRGDGLQKYNRKNGVFKSYRNNPEDQTSLPGNFVRVIYRDSKKRVWIGTYGGGLSLMMGKASGRVSFKNYYYDNRNAQSLSSDQITCILEDRSGVLWIGTENGLNRLNGDNSFTRYQYIPAESNSLGSNRIFSLYEDLQGVLWVGTSEGLCLFDKSRLKFSHYKHDPLNRQSLSNNYVYAIHKGSGKRDSSLWIGTAGGVNRFDRVSGTFLRFNEKDGLPDRVICGILEDEDGFVWLSTRRGLSKFDPKVKVFRNFDLSDGLQSNMFNVGAAHRMPNGELIFGGINGFNVFNPLDISSHDYSPPVYFTNIKVFDDDKKLPVFSGESEEIVLHYTDNFFTIRFVALDYTHPEKIQYAYRLEGVDKNWIHNGNSNVASYTNVAPGYYTFLVRATNSDGVWNSNITELYITIHPPFWQTWWFKTVVAVVFTSLIVLMVYFMMQKEKRKSALNKKIAELKLQALRSQMNPHFIFNTINSIQYFISNKDQKSAYYYLQKFSSLLRKTLDNSQRSAISVSEEVENLKLYLELQLLRFEDKFTFQMEVDPEIDSHNMEIPPMILQPYVENSIYHGLNGNIKKGKISIKLTLEGEAITCTIEDNGIGINRSLQLKKREKTNHKSTGMKVTQERLKTLNAKNDKPIYVNVIDLKEKNLASQGTRVTVHIPV